MYLRGQAIVGMTVLDRHLRNAGKVHDLYFDDISFAIRYLVVETGAFLERKRTLVAPAAISFISVARDEVGFNLSTQQIRASVDMDEMPAVSRQKEKEMSESFGWAPYWEYPMFPITNAWMLGPIGGEPQTPIRWIEKAEPNLRSFHEVCGYRIQTADKHWGYLDDFIIRSMSWVVRFCSIEHYRYLHSRKVIIDTSWITEVNWEDRHIAVNLPSSDVQWAPDTSAHEGLVDEGQLAVVIDYQRFLLAQHDGAHASTEDVAPEQHRRSNP